MGEERNASVLFSTVENISPQSGINVMGQCGIGTCQWEDRGGRVRVGEGVALGNRLDAVQIHGCKSGMGKIVPHCKM